MVALFPSRQLGVELGAILLIFTGQVWNMAFSFYASLKSIPREMREAAQIYRFSWWQRFTEVELPFAAIGLVWNSMMSVAGGWFFLMACEMFVLGSRDFRLPGLGSYLQTAASAGDTSVDLVGRGHHDYGDRAARPIRMAAGDRLGGEVQGRASGERGRAAFVGARSGAALACFGAGAAEGPVSAARISDGAFFAHSMRQQPMAERRSAWKTWLLRSRGRRRPWAVIGYAVARVDHAADRAQPLLRWRNLASGSAPPFFASPRRIVIGAAWAIPVGVWIGFNPRFAQIAQPLAQIAASVPATALFPSSC